MDYYNDIDRFACDWLTSLMIYGSIPFGEIDSRSISEIEGWELGHRRVHFFAGIGGWAEALRLAGWPEDREVWTGSCPCQPFSSAGKQKGFEDERHLWPEFKRLIGECRPATIFGEQVASKPGREWLSVVRTDLEAMGYAVGAADLCAASVGAPHIRQRLFWVANSQGDRWRQRLKDDRRGDERIAEKRQFGCLTGCGCNNGVANCISISIRRSNVQQESNQGLGAWENKKRARSGLRSSCPTDGLGHSDSCRQQQNDNQVQTRNTTPATACCPTDRLGHSDSLGSQGWLSTICSKQWPNGCTESCGIQYTHCRDGKARPVMPRVRLLAHGFPNRVGLLRGFGNAIVPQVAAAFIKSFLDAE